MYKIKAMNRKQFFIATSLLWTLLCSLGVGAQAKREQYILFKGIVESKAYDGYEIKMYGSDQEGGAEPEQTAVIKNGTFEIKVPFKGPGNYYFQSDYEMQKAGSGFVPFSIIVEKPGLITIQANMTAFHQSKVSGSTAQNVVEEMGQLRKQKQQEGKAELIKKYGKALVEDPMNNMDDPNMEAFYKEWSENDARDFENLLLVLAAKYPNSIAIPDMAKLLTTEKQEKVYAMLTEQNKMSRYGQMLKKNISVAHKSAVGKMIGDFSLPDQQGGTQNLKLLLAGKKYLLIDFWASWCMPCRQEFVNMRPLYNKYKENGFEILSISVDQNKKSWLDALKQENLPWPQVWDGGAEKDKQVSIAMFYVPSLPTTYLINAEGEIIGNDLRGKELEDKIATLLGKADVKNDASGGE